MQKQILPLAPASCLISTLLEPGGETGQGGWEGREEGVGEGIRNEKGRQGLGLEGAGTGRGGPTRLGRGWGAGEV